MRSRAPSRRVSVWAMRLFRKTTAVVTPTATQTAASTSMSIARSRARSVQARPRWVRNARSADRFEDIARPAHRVDHRLAAGVDLLAQVGDVQLDDVGLAAEVVVPHPVEDLGLAQHS